MASWSSFRVGGLVETRVIPDQAFSGVLKDVWIEALGLRYVAIVQDQLFKVRDKLLPLGIGNARVLLFNEAVEGEPPLRLMRGHHLPMDLKQYSACAFDPIRVMDHDRQIECAQRSHELVVALGPDTGRHGSKIGIDGEAGHFGITARLGDDGAHIPRQIGVSRLENRMLHGFRPRGPMRNYLRVGTGNVRKIGNLPVLVGPGAHRTEIRSPRACVHTGIDKRKCQSFSPCAEIFGFARILQGAPRLTQYLLHTMLIERCRGALQVLYDRFYGGWHNQLGRGRF